ncbi:uncharacterized protein METZ01_LOCUS187258, partial [marine metagenome]
TGNKKTISVKFVITSYGVCRKEQMEARVS